MKKTGYASIDKPWNQFYPNADITQQEIDRAINKSIYQMLDDTTKDIEDNVTIEYYGQEITNRNLKERILKCAKSFILLGVKKGDIVPLILPNQPESRILIYALNYIGAIAYPIQPSVSARQLGEIIEKNNVSNIAVFRGFYRQYKTQIKNLENVIYTTGKESLPKVLQYADEMSHLDPTTVIPYNEFILESKSLKAHIEPIYEKDKTATIIGTSGTTGVPKEVCLSNENINAMALQHMLGDMNINQGDVILNILIDSIGYGLGTMHYSGCCGLKSILIPKLVTDVSPLFLEHHPQHFTGGPIHAENLERYLKDPKNSENASKLLRILREETKNWVSGGAPLKVTTEEYLKEQGVYIRQGLGCTENGGAATFAKKGAYKEKSVGIPLMLDTISIFKRDTDEELKYYEEGEICISGPTVMQGYLNNPEETDKVLKLHSDGKIWIHTGDKGYIDEDGHVFIIGRYKQMTHRLGFNIHPKVIADDIISSEINGMQDCHVIALPHPKEQNVPVAFIQIEPTANINNLRKKLTAYAQENLNQYDIPYDYVFVIGDLPRNLGGKVDEKKLLELVHIDYSEIERPQYKVLNMKQKVKKR